MNEWSINFINYITNCSRIPCRKDNIFANKHVIVIFSVDYWIFNSDNHLLTYSIYVLTPSNVFSCQEFQFHLNGSDSILFFYLLIFLNTVKLFGLFHKLNKQPNNYDSEFASASANIILNYLYQLYYILSA